MNCLSVLGYATTGSEAKHSLSLIKLVFASGGNGPPLQPAFLLVKKFNGPASVENS